MPDLRKVALGALAAALADGRDEVKEKKGLSGVRAVAAGAVLVTAGRAAYKGGRFVRDRMRDDDEPEAYEDDEYEDEEYDDPEAEADEDFEDDEPEAEADDEEEPEAEADEDEEPEAEADDDDEPEAEADDDEPEAGGGDDDGGPDDEGDDGGPEADAGDDEPEGDEDDVDEGPDKAERPSSIEHGRPPIFDRPSGRKRRAGLDSKRSKAGESRFTPAQRPSRSRAPMSRV